MTLVGRVLLKAGKLLLVQCLARVVAWLAHKLLASLGALLAVWGLLHMLLLMLLLCLINVLIVVGVGIGINKYRRPHLCEAK